MSPATVYTTLLTAYGPQGWWPVTSPKGKVPEYHPGRWGRLTDRQRAEIALGAILTQNTAWTNVTRALVNLNAAGLVDLRRIASTPARRLARLIRPSGYFRQKTLKIRAFARHALSRGPLARWLRGPAPGLRTELLGIFGIGPETADSILLYAGGLPAFVVDAYTRRIGSRLGWFSARTRYHEAQGFLVRGLPRRARLYGEFHALLVEHAKRRCRASPLCDGCPLRRGCAYAKRLVLAAVFFVLASAGASAAASRAAASKVDITPDLARHRVLLAGFGATGRKPSGVHDPLYARIAVVSDGKNTVAIVGLDLLGFFRNDVEDLRRKTGFDRPGRYLFVTATHQHSGPDTLGLWGPLPGVSGVDHGYLREVKDKVAAALERLEINLEESSMAVAVKAVDPRGLCRDNRDPVVIDPHLGVLELRGKTGRLIATLVNWSCHPEVLGRDNRLLTADFPGPLCSRLEERRGGACLFLPGAIGGLMTPDSRADNFYEAYRIGADLAALAAAAIAKPLAKARDFKVSYASTTLLVPVENSRYLGFLPALAFGHVLRDSSGKPLDKKKVYSLPAVHVLRRLKREEFPWVETEVSRVDIGPLRLLGIPGEIFPELVIGGYDGRYRAGHPLTQPENPAPPELGLAPKGPYLREKIRAPAAFVVGLANDELGYIVPEYDFKVTPNLTLRPRPPGHHYEETNSIGPSATKLILEAAEALAR